MHQRGWYKTMPANQQQIQQFSNSMNTMYNGIMTQTAQVNRPRYNTGGYNYNNWQSNNYQWQQNY